MINRYYFYNARLAHYTASETQGHSDNSKTQRISGIVEHRSFFPSHRTALVKAVNEAKKKSHACTFMDYNDVDVLTFHRL